MDGAAEEKLPRRFLCPQHGLNFRQIFPRLATVGGRQQLRHKPIVSPPDALSDFKADPLVPNFAMSFYKWDLHLIK